VSQPNFRVGDEVQIIAQPPPKENWYRVIPGGRYDWVSGMDECCGNIYIVKEVLPPAPGQTEFGYRLRNGPYDWGWHECWFEKIEPDEPDSWTDELVLEDP